MVTFVSTPIGNLEDITYRTVKTLENADIFFCEDTRVVKRLIHLLGEKLDLKTKDNKEFISLNSHTEASKIEGLDLEILEKNCVFLSDAGTPCVSDPGAYLAQFCIDNNIKIDSLPGANAVLTAYSLSGFVESKFTFLGFLHNKGKERKKDIEDLLDSKYPSIFYESPTRLLSLLEEISKLDENRTVFLVKELTKMYQKIYKSSVSELYNQLKETQIKGEWTVIVAPRSEDDNSLKIEEIKNSDLKIKEKAKLLAEITDISPKEWYKKLLSN
ncbi:MAG: 16S rRNA (cytidine(1402)-2'-O)-methyltransferase [Campylobacterales bacterium]|nr:16S rRNA (cytidine(1402)-2'-O)-methyltransferase [Campylobacterales bacterium]